MLGQPPQDFESADSLVLDTLHPAMACIIPADMTMLHPVGQSTIQASGLQLSCSLVTLKSLQH